MIVRCLKFGLFQSNVYIVASNGEGVIIDAGVNDRIVGEELKSLGIKIKYIILTHGHIDHIIYYYQLKDITRAEIVIHKQELQVSGSPINNGSYTVGEKVVLSNADRLVEDGEILSVGGVNFKIIHTPGHTAGGICLLAENMLFTGDTLFRESIGRTDLYSGNMMEILESIKNKLFCFDENIIVYPGHGESSTIGHEIKNNPFFQGK